MSVKFKLINAALRAVGSAPIVENSGTFDERVMSDIYDMTVEQVMLEAGWHCLRKRKQLVRANESTDFGFSNSFIMPQDVLNIISVNQEQYSIEAPRFTIEGDRLLTDDATANMVYTSDQIDENKWDKHLTQTVKAALKVEIALNKTAAQGTIQLFMQQYEMLLRRNRARNSQMSGVQDSSDRTLLNARFTGYPIGRT